jgi:glycolate oxidase iron-sulfur subunit
MKELKDFKEEIHNCSKCGMCQSVCPVYKATGSDCAVSKGQFIMLKGVINGDLKMTKTINRYLSLCLKCGKCSEYCPSGIDVVDIISVAKYEYFKTHFLEKIISLIQKYVVFGLFPHLISFFRPKIKSKKLDKKVIYFGGCSSKYTGNNSVIKLLNNIGIEVITPDFTCCGIPFFVRGDIKNFQDYMNKYIKILKHYDIKEVVTTCASCEKTIKDYIKWCEEKDKEFLSGVNVRNIFEYLRENNAKLRLKKPVKVTYHRPCNQSNFDDLKYILTSTENLEYIEADNYDKCCGLNGIFKPKEYPIISKITNFKRNSIISTGAKYVLTSCFGCEIALNSYSLWKYKTKNLIEFLAENLESSI